MSVVAQQAFEKYFGQSDRTSISVSDYSEDAEAVDPMMEMLKKSISERAAIEAHISGDSTYWLNPQARRQKYLKVHVALPVEVGEPHIYQLIKPHDKFRRIEGVFELTPATRERVARVDYPVVNNDQEADLQRKFRSLNNEWREATRYTSSSTEIVMNDAYQRIIGLGPSVIPFVLAELRDHGGHWFWALRALTGENPVALENAGRVKKMTQDWLEWGQRKGLI